MDAAGRPLAAPSANRSGRVSPTLAEHVEADLGERVALILDGGPTAHGLESTVVDARPDVACCCGRAPCRRDEIEQVLGRPARTRQHATASGRRRRDSSPATMRRARALRLNAHADVHQGEALLAFGTDVPAHGGPVINLSARGDLSRRRPACSRRCARWTRAGRRASPSCRSRHEGLGEAINDRLAARPRRAARVS